MNKKASSVLMIIFELIAVILIITLTSTIGKAYGESSTILKINAAEDVRMMVDTLVSVPGDAIVIYPHNISGYNFVLTDGAISVSDADDVWISREFFLPKGYTAEGAVKNINHLCLEKKFKKIIVKDCNLYSQQELPRFTGGLGGSFGGGGAGGSW